MRFQTRWTLIRETWWAFWILIPWAFRVSFYLERNYIYVGIGDKRFGPVLQTFRDRYIGSKYGPPGVQGQTRTPTGWTHHYAFGNGCKRTAALWLVGKYLDNDSAI